MILNTLNGNSNEAFFPALQQAFMQLGYTAEQVRKPNLDLSGCRLTSSLPSRGSDLDWFGSGGGALARDVAVHRRDRNAAEYASGHANDAQD